MRIEIIQRRRLPTVIYGILKAVDMAMVDISLFHIDAQMPRHQDTVRDTGCTSQQAFHCAGRRNGLLILKLSVA